MASTPSFGPPPVARQPRWPIAAARPSAAVREMLTRLPGDMLQATGQRFPHVLEAIARDWASPSHLHATLDALLYDERGRREGFPSEVLLELAELRERYERWVGPR